MALDDAASALIIIDQTKLPNALELLHLRTQSEIWEAIRALKVRGAPAIGVAAAFGLYLAAKEIRTENDEEFFARFRAARDYLNSSRPNAVNQPWALDRMMAATLAERAAGIASVKRRLLTEARAIQAEDIEICRRIGELRRRGARQRLRPRPGTLRDRKSVV